MTCIKTGADVYLASRAGVLHGDMFLVGEVYIFHHTGMRFMQYGPCAESEYDFAFNDDDGREAETMYLNSANIIAMTADLVQSHD